MIGLSLRALDCLADTVGAIEGRNDYRHQPFNHLFLALAIKSNFSNRRHRSDSALWGESGPIRQPSARAYQRIPERDLQKPIRESLLRRAAPSRATRDGGP